MADRDVAHDRITDFAARLQAGVAHDIDCEHFAEATSLAACLQQAEATIRDALHLIDELVRLAERRRDEWGDAPTSGEIITVDVDPEINQTLIPPLLPRPQWWKKLRRTDHG